VFGTASAAGALFLTLAAVALGGAGFFLELGHLSWKGAGALIWMGPFGTTMTYLYWMFVLNQGSVASVSLTLFIQPICGALWGYVFLGDRLSVIQVGGGILILAAVFAETGRNLGHLTQGASPNGASPEEST